MINFEEIRENIKKSAFNGGKIPEYIAFLRWMKTNKLTHEDIEKYYQTEIDMIKKKMMDIRKSNFKSCPVCSQDTFTGRFLKGNPKGFTQHHFCINDECCFEEYA